VRQRPRERAATYAPQAWTETVPSGCSHVIVPLDVTLGCEVVPSLPICIEMLIVQSYFARPAPLGVSNRTPPVMCVVADMLLDPVGVAAPNV